MSDQVYKLAEHRYGREELLALYRTSSSEVTLDLNDSSVMMDKPVPPLALVPISDQEQVRVLLRVNPLLTIHLTLQCRVHVLLRVNS